MILSNIELHRALDAGRLVIKPEPSPRSPDPSDPNQYCPYDTHSVDLSLAEEIVIPEGGPFAFDLNQSDPLGPFLTKISKRVSLNASTGYPLKPNQFILARTREYVSLPIDHAENGETCLAARIEGKSSRARIGLLVHLRVAAIIDGHLGKIIGGVFHCRRIVPFPSPEGERNGPLRMISGDVASLQLCGRSCRRAPVTPVPSLNARSSPPANHAGSLA